ncbi:MAG: DNA recombination protein RmuC [Acidimicrobiales bacterium]|nr:DNA recombination protein RmuC [Acidimicrobiales bacterium]MCB1002793.1 DNA recombination protein RmuC [Acidimicrobiales bacterium]
MVLLTLFVILAVVAGLLAGVVVTVRVVRAQASVDRDAAVHAAVSAVLAERTETVAAVAAEREQTVQAVVATAVQVADAKLSDRLQSTGRETDLRHQSFERQVESVGTELRRIGELVTRLQNERAAQHGQVVQQLRETALRTAEVAATASTLRDALANPKARGQWGERMADDVLRLAGFVEGVNYRQQATTADGTKPDFTFLLPQERELNMDVKFPVDNYLRFLDADHDIERDAHRAQFAKDVRNRVKEITTRSYIDPERTVGYVLLFIPNEAVYHFVHQNDDALVDWALRQRVILCSPFTLFAVLAVVRQSVDAFRLERTGDEILECLGRFSKEWQKFGDQLDRVEKQLNTAHGSFENLNGTRRRMLERELVRIDDLRRDRGLDGPDVAAKPALREVAGR